MENNKLQIQVQQIDNGILVQIPGVTKNDEHGQQLIVKMPQALYCKDVDELCETLQRIWPRPATKLEILEKKPIVIRR